MLGMLVLVVVGKSMIHAASQHCWGCFWRPLTPYSSPEGDVLVGDQEIGVPRRVPKACEGPGDSSELKAAVSELCTCMTNPPC